MTLKQNALLCYLSLIFIVSCGGGGGGDGGVGNNPQPPVNDVLNPGLEGRFFFGCVGGVCTMDAETGHISLLPNTNFENQRNRFEYAGVTEFYVSTAEHDNSEFLIVGNNAHESYVVMQDYNGNELGRFDLTGEVLLGELSQDHQYIALFNRYGSVSNTPWLEIYTRDGRLISDKQFARRKITWLRDNRIVYSGGRSIYFTKAVSTDLDYALTLPSVESGVVAEGIIGDLEISPDESQAAFIVTESGGDIFHGAKNSRLYIMNIDGTDVRLLATTPGDENPSIIAPTWSPDGRWILVNEGYWPLNAVPIFDAESSGHLYIIPSDDPGKVYYLTTNTSERSPEVRLLRRYTMENEGSGITTQGLTSGYVPTWIPD